MELFIGNLPPGIEPAELRNLFRSGVFAPLRVKGAPRVVEFVDRNGCFAFYGHIKVASERLARHTMRRMDGRQWRGRLITVREFHYRAAGNERRAINWRLRYWEDPERRRSERRIFPKSAPVTSIPATGPTPIDSELPAHVRAFCHPYGRGTRASAGAAESVNNGGRVDSCRFSSAIYPIR